MEKSNRDKTRYSVLIPQGGVKPIKKSNTKAARGGSARKNALVKRRKKDQDLHLTSMQNISFDPLRAFTVSTGSTPGGVRVRGRELVQTCRSAATSGTFGAQNADNVAAGISLSPFVAARLGKLAEIYEMYCFHEARFEFVSNQPTTAVGEFFLAVDYDRKDDKPNNATDMMQNITSTMGNVYSRGSCTASLKFSRLKRYICNQDSDLDLDQTIQANGLFAFGGVTGTNVAVGYLLLTYDVEFFTPC